MSSTDYTMFVGGTTQEVRVEKWIVKNGLGGMATR